MRPKTRFLQLCFSDSQMMMSHQDQDQTCAFLFFRQMRLDLASTAGAPETRGDAFCLFGLPDDDESSGSGSNLRVFVLPPDEAGPREHSRCAGNPGTFFLSFRTPR